MSPGRAKARDVHCISPDLQLADAWHLMRQLRVRCLPVTWDGYLVGLLTDRDLLSRGTLLSDGSMLFGPFPVATAMTAHPLCAPAGASIATLAELMLEGCVEALPITDAGHRLLGMVTSSELLQVLATAPEGEAGLPLALQFSVREHSAVDGGPSA